MNTEFKVGDKVIVSDEYLDGFGYLHYSNKEVEVIPATEFTPHHCVNVNIHHNSEGGLNTPKIYLNKIENITEEGLKELGFELIDNSRFSLFIANHLGITIHFEPLSIFIYINNFGRNHYAKLNNVKTIQDLKQVINILKQLS